MSNGAYENKLMNFRIISLARRNKFYLHCIKNIIKPNDWGFSPNKNYRIFIAKNTKTGKILGFLIYRYQIGGEQTMSMSLEYWLVDKKFQGQGIGKMLWDEFVKESNTMNLLNWSVMFKATDERLVAIYTKLGFSYIPKYNGIEQEKLSENEHTVWWRIVYTHYNTPTWFGKEGKTIALVE